MSIDDRVVELSFDNKQFEAAVATTMQTLAKLQQSLQFPDAGRGLDDISKHFNANPISSSIEGISGKFLALATIGVTALTRITDAAISAGTQLVKSLTITPIADGLKEYETTLNSVQTILANTQASGATLKDVNGALKELNDYSDKTIYNFSEMARNIGTFTAAGVDLKTSTEAIKGIANLAALSGSNSQQASTAMYQLSQAIASGKVGLQDWNSVVNAGMGGTVFQRALAQTAVKMGTLSEDAVKLKGKMKNVTVENQSFRNSLTQPGKDPWLTKEVLTKTLSQFTGDLTDAQLAAEGFSKAEILAIQKQAKTAQAAATNVKTLSQVIDVARETAGSGWAQTWQIIFGDFKQAKRTFTDLSNAVNGVINGMSDARNNLLEGWAKAGGRTAGIEAIKNAFAALTSVLKPIKEAFREIFPPVTGKQLAEITKTVRDFFASIKLGPEQMDLLKRTFAGLFAVLDIGKQILSGVIHFIGDLFSQVGKGSGGFLEVTANIGDFLVHLDDMIKKGQFVTKFFDKLSDVVHTVAGFLGDLGAAISDVFGGDAFDSAGAKLDTIGERLSPLAAVAKAIKGIFTGLGEVIKKMAPAAADLIQNITKAFSGIGQAIADSVANGNYNAALDTINTVLFGGFIVLFKKFTSNGIFGTKGGGLFKSISGSFNQLTGVLKSMQTQIQAKTLLLIAGAIALITVSLVALSLIDSAKLTKALVAMSVGLGELVGALAILGQIGGTVKIPIMAASLVLLASAMVIMAGAMKILSTISWEGILKGLVGMAGALAAVAVGMALMPSKALLRQAAALVIIGLAMNEIAAAMKIFATLSWQDMAKGLVGIAGAIAAIGLALQLMPVTALLQAAALTVIAVALGEIAGVIAIFGTMEWKTIGKGLAAMAGALLIIAAAVALMPGPMMIATGAGLLLVATAVTILAGALLLMASMSWEDIAQGLVALGGSLLILAGGLYLMSGTLAGAAALVVAAAGLAILAPVLKTLGELSWGEIVKGLVALAGALLVIGVAAALMSPVIVQLLLLGAAVALLGLGLALAGLGVLAFATALTALIAAGSLGTAALAAIFATIIGLIPAASLALQVALVGFAGAIGAAAPAIIEALTKIIVSLLDALIKLTPKIMKALGVLLDALIKLALKYSPKLIAAGIQIIIDLLTGIEKAIPRIAAKVTRIILAFLDALATNYPKLIDGAFKAMIKFIDGISDAIDANSAELGAAGGRLATSIIEGVVKGIAGGAGAIAGAMKGMASNAINSAKNALHINSPSKDFIAIGKSINEGLIKGVVGGKADVVQALKVIGDAIKAAVQNSVADIKELKGQLKTLRDKPKSAKNDKEIAKVEKALKEAEKAHEKALEANQKFTKGMDKQKAALKALGTQYDKTTEKLKAAKDKLAAAIKERDDFKKSIIDQYSVLPEIDATTSLDNYFDAIRKATEDNIKFKATLDQLRNLGLDDTSYKKLLAEGVTAQPFVDSLLAAGTDAVTELNKIDSSLSDSATSLGESASKSLYQAGVDSAQGLVDGLEKQMDTIIKQMEKIGAAMAKAIKKELGIKSPSKVFAEIGKFTNEGLAKGLDDSSNVVDISAGRVGKVAIDSMKESLSKLPDILAGEVDMNPVIAPVLDLDSFRKDAAGLNALLAVNSIVPTTSASTATSISATEQAQRDATAAAAADSEAQAGTNVEFNQYNTSPKALSTAEIYRQSKNQLSVLKEVVKSA